MDMIQYQLPDGRVVDIHADAARWRDVVTFTQIGGVVVDAVRVSPLPTPEPGDVVEVDDRKSGYSGCTLTLIERVGGWFVCRNDTCGTFQTKYQGRYVGAIRVRSVRFIRKGIE